MLWYKFLHSAHSKSSNHFERATNLRPLYIKTISIGKVLKRLKKLDGNKADGPDKLQPRLLKEAADQIAESVAVIFRMSVMSKVLPSDLKPAHLQEKKKGSSHYYCPISLTSVVCKVLESVINDALVSHLEKDQ